MDKFEEVKLDLVNVLEEYREMFDGCTTVAQLRKNFAWLASDLEHVLTDSGVED